MPSSDYSVSSYLLSVSTCSGLIDLLKYFHCNLVCSLFLCLLKFSIISERGKILRGKNKKINK